MNRFPPPPRQFSERLFFVGEASSADERTIGPLDCVIDHSRIGQHGLHGWILGNKTTKKLLDPFWKTPLTLKTKGDDAHGFVAAGVRLGSIGSFSMEGLAEPVSIVADFTCDSFRANFGIAEKALERATRLMEFHILGPKGYWHIDYSSGYERDGSRKIEVYQPDLDLGELPFVVSVGPSFVRDREDDQHVERSLVRLQLLTTQDVESYPDDLLVRDAIAVADDLCLLVGFLSGAEVSWLSYGFSLSQGDGFETRSIGGRIRSRAEANRFDPVGDGKARAFLRVAFPKLRRLRESGVDLAVPLRYCVVAPGVEFWRQRFGELFLALEAIRSSFLDAYDAEFLTSDTVFKKLRSGVKNVVSQTPLRARGRLFRDDEISALVEKKVTELNRPPFWDGLRPLLDELGVPWEDLYPEPVPAQPTFVNVRHKLFHSHRTVDDEVLAVETMRLEGVVHRLLLRWLDWDDLWHAPNTGVRYVLTGQGLPRDGFVRKLQRQLFTDTAESGN